MFAHARSLWRRGTGSFANLAVLRGPADPRHAQHEEVVERSLWVAIALGPLLGLFYAEVASPSFGWWYAGAELIWLGCLVLLRRAWPTLLVARIALGVLWMLCIASFWLLGGYESPVMSWIFVLPIATALLTNERDMWASLGLAVVIVAVFWGLTQLGIAPPDTTRGRFAPVAPLLYRELAIGVLGALLGIWLATQRTLERRLALSLESAREQEQNVRLLLEASALSNASGGFQEVSDRLLGSVCRSLGARHARIWRWTDRAGLAVAAEHGFSEAARAAFPPERTRALFAADYRAQLLELSSDPAQPHRLALEPIWFAGQLEGVLELHLGKESRSPIAVAELLTQVATQLSHVAERERTHRAIHDLAYHDALSGLPNRHALQARLPRVLDQLAAANTQAALLFIDLNGFKRVNDSLGHDAGDLLLREVADRLRTVLRLSDHLWRSQLEMDPLARLGGDEFTVLASGIKEARGGEIVAERILSALADPIRIEGHEVVIGASIGIALFPADASTAKDLIQFADQAMYRAKQRGASAWERYDGRSTMTRRRFELGEDLRRALTDGSLTLHYQPVVGARDGALIGAEALLRWNHPSFGMVPPGEFVPIAETTGLIEQLGCWVIEEVCRQAAAWAPRLPAQFRLAANVSGRQLLSPIEEHLARAIAQSGCDPSHLELELTETALLVSSASAESRLRKIVELGVRVVLDDFGTGYSSLVFLKQFPISKVKIDRLFVNGLPNEAGDVAISLAIIAMAHSLGLAVVAEGVEDEAQQEFLALRGCDAMQGYLFGKPIPAAEFAQRWLGGEVRAAS